MSDRLTKYLDYTKVTLFTWWFLTIYFITIYFKYRILNKTFKAHGGFSNIVENLIKEPSIFERQFYWLLIFNKDFIDILIVLMIIFLLANALLKIKPSIITITSFLFAMLILFVNSVSFEKLRTFMSIDSILITFNWLKDNPGIINSDISKKMILLYVIIVLLLSLLPLIVLKLSERYSLVKKINRITTTGILIAFPISLFLYFITNFLFVRTIPFPLQGYWGNTVDHLFGNQTINPLSKSIPSREELLKRYYKMVFPAGLNEEKELIVDINKNFRRPRHILIFKLETAPRKYYPITNNKTLPNFYKMSSKSITNENHYTNTPFTNNAYFSILSGTYPLPQGTGSPIMFGKFETDGIVNILTKNNYNSIWIDTYMIDWHGGQKNKETLENLGFNKIIEIWNKNEKRQNLEFKAITVALNEIKSAEENGKKALIYVNSDFGHYKWEAPDENSDMSNFERMRYLNNFFDSLLGSFIDSLDVCGLSNDVIITIVGDHGFRYKDEFASLGEEMGHSDLAFNVAFMIYAPGIIDSQVTIPYITSHVDITPTLLFLIGNDSTNYLHHGMNMLDSRIHERVTFMLNTGLSSIDGYSWRNNFITYDKLIGKSQIANRADRKDVKTLENEAQVYSNFPRTVLIPSSLIDSANALFEQTAGYFLKKFRDGIDKSALKSR